MRWTICLLLIATVSLSVPHNAGAAQPKRSHRGLKLQFNQPGGARAALGVAKLDRIRQRARRSHKSVEEVAKDLELERDLGVDLVNERLVYACRGLDVLPNSPAAAVAASAAAEAAAYDTAVLAGYEVSPSNNVQRPSVNVAAVQAADVLAPTDAAPLATAAAAGSPVSKTAAVALSPAVIPAAAQVATPPAPSVAAYGTSELTPASTVTAGATAANAIPAADAQPVAPTSPLTTAAAELLVFQVLSPCHQQQQKQQQGQHQRRDQQLQGLRQQQLEEVLRQPMDLLLWQK